MTQFRCITLIPLRFASGPIVSTLRAGGIALVDCADATDTSTLGQLFATLPPNGETGLRLTPEQSTLSDVLAGRPHHLVLCGWRNAELPDLLERLQRPDRSIWLEMLGSDDLFAVDPGLPFVGWLGRGSECGGRCGRESAFILCQHLARQIKPFWIQGSIGLHSAAACRVGGAAGVVLDDSLLLLRDFPLSARWRAAISELGMEDTITLGEEWNESRRIANRASLIGSMVLRTSANNIAETVAPAAQTAAWIETADRLIGWGDPATHAWPLGQAVGRATEIAARHGTIGRLIRAVSNSALAHLAATARLRPLATDGALALMHGTTLPVVQGPMTRVSDHVPFAEAVADAGGLPMLALSMMSGMQVQTLLDAATTALAPRAWGIGLMGNLPPALAEEQLAAVAKIRPPFALIAGGRPDQASRLESLGITTYIHVPTPSLLRLFLEQGARRFIFEGSECGGHVGPLNSFTLWDAMIDTLLSVLPTISGETVDILFAGGIHDARSAAMTAVMAAPLVENGVRLGVLMGSAYLFTSEAVNTGAIIAAFQHQAQKCHRTAIIETRPGHRIRCAPTPFVAEFEVRRRDLRRNDNKPAELGDALENMLAGKLRIASKGVVRGAAGLVPADQSRIRDEGIFMMGELTGLRSTTLSCTELHNAVTEGATTIIADAAAKDVVAECQSGLIGEPVAIIGIGCLLPSANDPETLWRNLLDKVDAIREIPRERWDWRLYFDADPAARDRIYSKWGGFIDPLPFDPLGFGIPPKSLASICLPQLLALEATRRALQDARLDDLADNKRLRERTATIFGAASAGDLEQMYKARTAMPLISQIDEDAWRRLPEWSEESYPGILLNIVAGRVANRFDLGGPNFTVDAACASSLVALDLAVRELQSGRSDMVLAGAVDAELSPHAYMAFSKTHALSAQGRARVFDEDADGIVLSEGAVTLVLKRLADAEHDGDRVYAVIRGIAGTSDGKGMGLTAPKSSGQISAMKRAHEVAGTTVASLGLYEAHGTGTKVGDSTELETITAALRCEGALPGTCAIGSAKSLIGHTRAAAGLTGVVKVALALHHRVLPPHSGINTPLPPLRESNSPTYLIDQPQPWLRFGNLARRAGVSAFGFGGTNFHAVLEEHSDRGADGADRWSCEMVVLAAADRAGLLSALARLQRVAEREELELRDLAYSSIVAAANGGSLRLAVVAGSKIELRNALTTARNFLESGIEPGPGVFLCLEPTPGDLAFLFPGQGSQYPGMGAELALYSPELRNALEYADTHKLILPPAAFTEDEHLAQEQALTDTRVAQPAIAALSSGMLDFARRLELSPTRVAGHSFGEFVALHAAGVLCRNDLYLLAATRGRIISDIGSETGAMAVVALNSDQLAPYLVGADGVYIANRNSPRQMVLSGSSSAIEEILGRLREDDHTARLLSVSAAFHSPLMHPARAPFADFLTDGVVIERGVLPVHANLDGLPYPTKAGDIRSRLSDHMEQPVDFIAQIEAMWQAGVRSFLELGPGRTLTGLVRDILGERPYLAVSADGGLRGWLSAIAQLWSHGHTVNLDALFDARRTCYLDFDHLPEPIPQPGFMMDGGRIYRVGQASSIGELPLLDMDSPVSVAPSADSRIAVYGEYQETMRQFLHQQERILSELLKHQDDSTGMQLTPPITVDTIPLPALPISTDEPVEITLDRKVLTDRLIQLVCDRTGYLPEMLRIDQDLEGELGIDSIKRIEIISNLINSLPTSLAIGMQKRFNRLLRAKSLQTLIDVLLHEALNLDLTNIPHAVSEDVPCPRYVMKATVKPLLRLNMEILRGLYVVSADMGSVAELVMTKLRSHGARVCLLAHHELTDPASLGSRLAVLREVHGPVRGVIHLAGLGLPPESVGMPEWRAATAVVIKGLFTLLQYCGNELDNETDPLRLLAVSQLGGDWGRSGNFSGSPVSGGSHGILRSLECEFPHIFAKMADFDDFCPNETVAERIVDEILAPGGGNEIGYRHGQRIIFTPERLPLARGGKDTNEWHPQDGWVVLVTGGARGITAEICREIAAPGVRLVLVGRREISDTETLRERETNFEYFRQTGAHVEYHAVDVRSDQAFGDLIDDLYSRYGRIDAVLHGAGVIEDRRFAAKESDSFDRVFDTKVNSTFILSRRLRSKGLKWVVLFGSIAGRFGNHGQADYAAANETQARLGQQMDMCWRDTRVVTIVWGPWRGAGMASEGLQALFEAQGIVPIELNDGRRFFVDEMTWGRKGENEIIAGRGPWNAQPDQLLASVFHSSALMLQASSMTGMNANSK